MATRILLVDDEPDLLASVGRLLKVQGYEVETAEGGAAALTLLEAHRFDVCVTDLRMPDHDGLEVLAAGRNTLPPTPVVVCTGQGTVKDAVTALRNGASDFLAKPFHVTALKESLDRILSMPAQPPGERHDQRAALIGEHPAIRNVLDRIEQVADTDANVLIRGETGTGKEVVARLIHASSGRRSARFVPVNMAAIPEALAESELFGHARGAFTDASRARIGQIRAAQGGTLFLDEVGDMPKALQAKLLRVLQDRVVAPVGGGPSQTVDVRIIAATHRNLEQMVRAGEFREDLFYRLDVIPVELPPLRARREDVPLLAEHFRQEANHGSGRSVPPFPADVLLRLCAYDWPGNVRQLENTVERLVLVAADRPITVEDLPPSLRSDVIDLNAGLLDLPPAGIDLRQLLNLLEERFIEQALRRTGGNRHRAAELLGMNRTTLVEKLRRRAGA